jgi:hypothetical protein
VTGPAYFTRKANTAADEYTLIGGPYLASKKKRRSRRQRARHESYQQGPFRLERLGKTLRWSSSLVGEEFAEHRRRISEQQPVVREEINGSAEKLLAMTRLVDPLHLLGAISMHHCFVSPESYRESTDEHHPEFAEYAQSLALSVERPAFDGGLTRQQYTEFHKQIIEIYGNIRHYLGAQIADKAKDLSEAELQFKAVMAFLGVRGDAFPEHMNEHVAAIYGPHDAFLRARFGTSANEILSAVDAICEQVTDRIVRQPLFKALSQLQQLVASPPQAPPDPMGEESGSMAMPTSPEALRLIQTIRQEADRSPAWVFRLASDHRIPARLLGLLSARFGENSEFALFKKSPAWPTNTSIIFERPLVNHDGSYYCFLPHLLRQQLDRIVEAMIRSEDERYFATTFQAKRSAHLESVSVRYLARMLPGASVFTNVFYNVVEAGVPKRPETDAIIVYDQTLFIVEAKSGGVSLATRRGGAESIRDAIKDQVAAGHSQGLRARNYILETGTPIFEYEDGRPAIALDKSRIKEIFIVIPTLERLGALSITLNVLRELGLLPGGGWPWCVYVNDLRVISEIVEGPSEFLLYIESRTQWNDSRSLDAHDELDYFMWFLRDGLYFDPNVASRLDKQLIASQTEELDRYYDFLAGRVSSGPKPRIRVNDTLRQLIARIEASGSRGFSSLSLFLLKLSADAQKRLVDLIADKQGQFARSGTPQSASLGSEGLRRGLTIWVGEVLDVAEMKRMDDICVARKKSTSSEEWFLLALIGVDLRIKVNVYDRFG